MLKKILFTLFTVLSLQQCIYSQTEVAKSLFISAHSGGLITSLEDFDKTYDSQAGFVYGIGLGIPFTTRSYLYGKATLFAKNGTPVNKTYGIENGKFVLISETKGGTAKFTEWIFNAGYMYNFFLSPDWTLGINGGISILKMKEEKKYIDGISTTSDGTGLFGFFAGAALEKNFGKSPFSVFVEIQFNVSRGDVLQYVGDYGGVNINAGARYYLKARRLE